MADEVNANLSVIQEKVRILYKKVGKQNVLLDEMFPTQNYLHGIVGDYRQTTTRLEKELVTIMELLPALEKGSEDYLARLFGQITILHRPKFFDGEERDVTLTKTSSPDFKWSDSITLYQQFQKELEKNAEEWTHRIVGSPFQDFGLELIFKDDNTFNKKALRCSYGKIGNSTKEVRKKFLDNAGEVFNCDLEDIIREYVGILRDIENALVSINKLYEDLIVDYNRPIPSLKEYSSWRLKREGKLEEVEKNKYKLKDGLLTNKGWGNYLKEIADYLFSLDTFNLYEVFKVDHLGRIFPVERFERYSFSDLIGYENQKKILKTEIESFLSGEDTNNIYIYGPPGTGKSTMVNGLITEYEELRLILLDKHQARLLGVVYSQIRDLDYKFLIFFDELSYAGWDQSYKVLQEEMEGVVDRLPRNVRIYAAANTKNPVFTRQGVIEGGLEIPDQHQALADRFGIKIEFPLPDEVTQINILEHYACKKGITTPLEELMLSFRQWCKENDHLRPNGRNIRDYVKTLKTPKEKVGPQG